MIDFDHNATTRLSAAAVEAMANHLGCPEEQANPSSPHAAGRRARARLEAARRSLASSLGAHPLEIVFTSGGTESNNLGIAGMYAAMSRRAAAEQRPPPVVAAMPIEHPSALVAVARLEARGTAVHWMAPDIGGRWPAVQDLAAELDAFAGPSDLIVVAALANHELGNHYPMAQFVAQLRARRNELAQSRESRHASSTWIHCDAVAALGRVPVEFAELAVDALSISAHKVGGPKGAGALVVRRGSGLVPQTDGGSQERGMRTGTENMLGIIGMARAIELAVVNRVDRSSRVRALREQLVQGLEALAIEGLSVHGDPDAHVGNTLLVTIEGCTGELLAMNYDLAGYCISTGSACNSGSAQGSAVLAALGHSGAGAAMRISLGHTNSAEEIAGFVQLLPEIVARIRGAREGSTGT